MGPFGRHRRGRRSLRHAEVTQKGLARNPRGTSCCSSRFRVERYRSHQSQCEWHTQDSVVPLGYYAKVVVPFAFDTSVDLFNPFFASCDGASPSTSLHKVTLKWTFAEGLGVHAVVLALTKHFDLKPPEPSGPSAGEGGAEPSAGRGRGRG
jgi:hypothetical protein